MTSLTLYQIAHEYRQITDVLMDSDVDEQTLADTLEGERWNLETKARNYGAVIRNLEATAANIKAGEVAMKARREAIEKRAASLAERLKTGMEIAGVTSLECQYFAATIRNNPPSVDVWDAKQIPAKFMRVMAPVQPPDAPDKIAIARAIKAGEDVPGCLLARGTKIVIK